MIDTARHFADRLSRAIDAKGTALCVGFDPYIELLPEYILKKYNRICENPTRAAALSVEEFLLKILEQISPYVAVIKPQFAFFERLGAFGMEALARICKEARARDLIVIGDAKRGDIGSTAEAYAAAYLGVGKISEYPPEIRVDALTINPYLGWDSILPFLHPECETGIFILVKTSNPSAGQFQDLEVGESTLAERIAGVIHEEGKCRIGASSYSDMGAVVGAPYPAMAIRLRELMPNTLFLIPGYGFQGATAEDAIVSLDENGQGGIINSSRAVLYSYRSKERKEGFSEETFDESAKFAVIRATEELALAIRKKRAK
jgi:orotidine-5'-phosphate decarboxylase